MLLAFMRAGIGAVELLIIAVVVLVAIRFFQRRAPGERHGAGRAMALGCGLTVFLGGLSMFLVLAVILVRVNHKVRSSAGATPAAAPNYSSVVNSSALEIHLLAPNCQRQDIKPTELATVILALTNEIIFDNDEIVSNAHARTTNEQLRTWEHAIVRADRKRIELEQVAQISRRHPNGGWQLPIDTIIVVVGAPHNGMRAADFTHRLVEDTSLLLSAVADSRSTSVGMQSFQIERESDALVLRLPIARGDAPRTAEGRRNDYRGNAISAIELELTMRGWADKSPATTAERPADADESKHSFGEWMVAVFLAESTLDGLLGADAWQEVWPTIAEAGDRSAPQHAPTERAVVVPARPEALRFVNAPEAPLVSDTTKVEVEIVPERDRKAPAGWPQRANNDHPVSAAVPPAPVGGARPAWVDLPPEQRVGDDGVLRLVGTTQALWSTPQESQVVADEVLQQLFSQYVRRAYGSDEVGKIRLPRETSDGKVVSWTEPQESTATGMTMYETHVMLALDQHDRHVIEERLQSVEIRRRVRLAGAGAGLLLGLIATLWGYLKLDTASRGYYSGRLKLAAGAAAIALVSGALAAVRGV